MTTEYVQRPTNPTRVAVYSRLAHLLGCRFSEEYLLQVATVRRNGHAYLMLTNTALV